MAVPAELPPLLSSLSTSIQTALSSLPDSKHLAPPPDSLSLLTTKTELLLSYLHNLTFLIILNLRKNHHTSPFTSTEEEEEELSLQQSTTRTLVSLRIYLEKGVRPLESKLKYQLDKLLQLASEADSASTTNNHTHRKARPNQTIDTEPAPSSLSHRPNLLALTNPTSTSTTTTTTTAANPASDFYRPPKITPTSLPPKHPHPSQNQKPPNSKPSRALASFIHEELDDAPTTEPSIGAGSSLRGRAKEREEERKGYEESRLVRLPVEKKRGKGEGNGVGKRKGVVGDGRQELEVGELGLGEDEGRGEGRKRRRVDGGGGGGWGGGKKGEGGLGGLGGRVGEAWERRVGRGVGRRR